MLTFESPFFELRGVIVFRDHADATLFHYLAGPPHLTRIDNKPSFLLLTYRHVFDASTDASTIARDQLGGAFLTFGVDCGIPEELKNSIKSDLQAMVPPGAGPAKLVPVLYTRGKVNVVALDRQTGVEADPQSPGNAQSKFVRGILGTSTPSLLQDQRAIFSIALDTDAAVLLEKAYESEMSPIGVMYELEFAGLRPALSVVAHVDQKRVYDQFKAMLTIGIRPDSGGAAPTGTGVAGGVGGQPAGSTAGQPPGAVAGAGGAGGTGRPTGAGHPTAPGAAEAQHRSGGVAIDAEIGLTLENLRQTGAIRIEIIRQQEGQSVDQMERNAMELLKESVLKDFFRPAMTTEAPPSAASTAAAAAATATSLMSASTAQTNNGRAGSGSNVQVGFQLQYKRQEELREVDYDYSVTAPETRTHSPNGFFSALLGGTEKTKHIREIDLNDPFFKTLDVDITTTADFALLDIKAVVVELQYGGTVANPKTPGAAVFTPQDAAAKHFMSFLDDTGYNYRYQLNYKFGQAESIAAQKRDYTAPWRTTTRRALVVHPAEDIALLNVYVEPGVVDWTLVDKIETTLRYADARNQFEDLRTFLVADKSERQEWIVRLTDPAVRNYDVKYKWHLKDSREFESDWRSERIAHLFVADPFLDRLEIVVDPRVDPNNIARINVLLEYADEANQFFVRRHVELDGPEFRPTRVTIPLMNTERREFRYSVSLVKSNGQSENHEPKTTDSLSIVVTEGGIYLDVDIALIGKMDALAIDALQLDLRSEPLDGQEQKLESHLFLQGAEVRVKKRLLLRKDRPQKFEYRTRVLAGTREVEADWKEHGSSILTLQLARLLNP